MNINLDTELDPQLTLLQFLKESPKFGWVKKLQRTVGFYSRWIFDFFFKTHLKTTKIYNNQVYDNFDNHEYQP